MTHKTDLKDSRDIVAARLACREMARALGFGLADQTRLTTAVSELARNVIHYAGEGLCDVTDASDNETAVIRVVVEEHGPCIADVDLAMQDGFTTNGGLGGGLPGVARLMDEFEIQSQVDVGTWLVARKWSPCR